MAEDEGLFYLSTRDSQRHKYSFDEVLLGGVAPDGGLYVPQKPLPLLERSWKTKARKLSYQRFANVIMRMLLPGDIDDNSLQKITEAAYGSFAKTNDICPLIALDDNHYIVEQFHGPTLAFKDFALQLLSQLVMHRLRGTGKHAVIIGATSGDTGAAAIEAFKQNPAMSVFILFPDGRISEHQRLQMTSSGADNVYPIAVKGVFDDCQSIVKKLFNANFLAEEYILCGVNSVNWFRIVAQIVYYLYTLARFDDDVVFCVPTGNFGNALAGYYARTMVEESYRLLIATNANDILYRSWKSGVYNCQKVEKTSSPSMDIQISSNFERFLYHISSGDCEQIKKMMQDLNKKSSFTLPPQMKKIYNSQFDCHRVSEVECKRTMMKIWQRYNYILDPHSAIAMSAAQRSASVLPQNKFVTMATAHPSKFPHSVKNAIGIEPEIPLELLKNQNRKEHYTHIEADFEQVKNFIKTRIS